MALFTTIISSSLTLERRLAQRRVEETARARIAALRAAHAAKAPGPAQPSDSPQQPDLHPVEALRRAGRVHHR